MAVSEELTKITRNGQITLPAGIRREAGLEEGDYLAVRLDGDDVILTPKKLIDKSQAYFWTEEWQKRERQADEDKKAGRSVSFDSAEEAIRFLRLRDKDAH